jgi:hypothetical protein
VQCALVFEKEGKLTGAESGAVKLDCPDVQLCRLSARSAQTSNITCCCQQTAQHVLRCNHGLPSRGLLKAFVAADPLGVKHSLANPGKVPLELIEVQSGIYLGEDDIVRFEDRYGRLSK